MQNTFRDFISRINCCRLLRLLYISVQANGMRQERYVILCKAIEDMKNEAIQEGEAKGRAETLKEVLKKYDRQRH